MILSIISNGKNSRAQRYTIIWVLEIVDEKKPKYNIRSHLNNKTNEAKIKIVSIKNTALKGL
jgi:hypothetical protein